MPAKLTLEIAKKRISLKFKHISLLTFNGTNKKALFLDHDYGEFEYQYESVYYGKANHPIRAAIRKDKRLSFDQAAENIKNKYTYITLIRFTKTEALADFIDDEFGPFTAKYCLVYYGHTGHKQRSLKNKINSTKRKSRNEKIKQTNLKKYGVENVRQVPEFHKKAIETNLKLYGVENVATLDKFVKKAKKTNIIKYGTVCTLQNKDVHFKTIKTNIKKYGVPHASQAEIVKNKVKETNLLNFGCESPSQNDDIKNKSKLVRIKSGNIKIINGKTMIEIAEEYGYSYSFISNYIKSGKDIKNLKKKSSHQTMLEHSFYLLIEKISNNIRCGLKENLKVYDNNLMCKPDFILNNILAIECDGLYWHSDQYRDDKYHINKKNIYNANYLKSLFFRSDEIYNKSNIVKSIILAKLKLSSNKIYARSCTIQEIHISNARQFFDNNHLDGYGSGKTFGLIYNEEIVCAITISKRNNNIEITRFCNKLNTVVIGGLSKLISHIIKVYGINIYCTIDMRYGDGESLIKLGFQELSNKVSYRWTDFKNTYFKDSYRNNSGYDSGLYKIYDCGQKRFKLLVSGG